MDAKTREALEASIAHWEENVAASNPFLASTAADDCALCDLFHWSHECEKCPVGIAVKNTACRSTPYTDADRALQRWICMPSSALAEIEWRAAAQSELDFLKSLRPTDEPANGGDNA